MSVMRNFFNKNRRKPEQDSRKTGNDEECQTDRIRILLFQECQRKGRNLLFDSASADKNVSNGLVTTENGYFKNSSNNYKIESDSFNCKNDKLSLDDVNFLGEMIFGSVAMNFKGSSFKIHAIDATNCLMFTKILSLYERNTRRKCGYNSSSNDLNQNSQTDSGNSSTRSVSPVPETFSSSSSESIWDLDVLPQIYNLTNSIDFNNLSKIRHKILHSVSNSLIHNEAGSESSSNSSESSLDYMYEVKSPKYKSKLGLAILIQFSKNFYLECCSILLKHAALLEATIDRLLHLCLQSRMSEKNLLSVLSTASLKSTTSFLSFILSRNNKRQSTTLIWHNLLLNATESVRIQAKTVHRSLQQMFKVIENYDTKSTNFFISTIVTAVLTHHLGWVHTAAPKSDNKLIEKLQEQYPYNPFWAQLCDLYGSIGSPSTICKTVIAGDPEKKIIIESVLNFLSYFVRSGAVKKKEETLVELEEDVKKAISVLDTAFLNNPLLVKMSTVPRKTHQKHRLKSESKKCFENSFSCSKFDSNIQNSKKPNIEGVGDQIPKPISTNTSLNDSLVTKVKQNSFIKKNFETYVAELCALDNGDEDEEDIKKMELSTEIVKEVYENDVSPTETIGFDSSKLNFKSSLQAPLVFPTSITYDNDQILIPLKAEDIKPTLSIRERLKSASQCQCSYTFTRIPSTSAELPEGILRKIIQRNFPESSKSLLASPGIESELCQKCHKDYSSLSKSFENGKLFLETPTNATEMLRGCGPSTSSETVKLDTLETLLKTNYFIELPMPSSKEITSIDQEALNDVSSFTNTLISTKIISDQENSKPSGSSDISARYMSSMVVQGVTKKKKVRRKRMKSYHENQDDELDYKSWWWPIYKELSLERKFSVTDHPISEAFCIVGDIDNWQVGLLSNRSPSCSSPVPVGMSSLVSNMIEAFMFLWKEYHSPEECLHLLESRLREIWLRSKTLSEYLLTNDFLNPCINNVTKILDIDINDLPLLLAVATTHTPQIMHKLSSTMA